MKNFIKQEYCKEFGYSSFNKNNKTNYSNWLEKKLIEARTEVENLSMQNVSVKKMELCDCVAPIIRTGNNANEYCASCGNDLN